MSSSPPHQAAGLQVHREQPELSETGPDLSPASSIALGVLAPLLPVSCPSGGLSASSLHGLILPTPTASALAASIPKHFSFEQSLPPKVRLPADFRLPCPSSVPPRLPSPPISGLPVLRCVCGVERPCSPGNREPLIECEGCGVFQHALCVACVSTSEPTYCELCEPDSYCYRERPAKRARTSEEAEAEAEAESEDTEGSAPYSPPVAARPSDDSLSFSDVSEAASEALRVRRPPGLNIENTQTLIEEEIKDNDGLLRLSAEDRDAAMSMMSISPRTLVGRSALTAAGGSSIVGLIASLTSLEQKLNRSRPASPITEQHKIK